MKYLSGYLIAALFVAVPALMSPGIARANSNFQWPVTNNMKLRQKHFSQQAPTPAHHAIYHQLQKKNDFANLNK